MRPLSVDSVPSLLGLIHVWQRIYSTRASSLGQECEQTIGHAKKQDRKQDRLFYQGQSGQVKKLGFLHCTL